MATDPSSVVYAFLLQEACDVADQALDRLRRLGGRFPADIPGRVLDQLERIRSGPDGERRAAVRLDGDGAVGVRDGELVACPVLDRSAGGLSVRFGHPVGVGEVFGVITAGGIFPAQVRHCHPAAEGGWVVGCEFVGDRPPG